jgi:tungstate transport system ATP-binding protein
MNSAAYRVLNLRHAYDGRTVLDIPDLKIARGEVCALAGPNGSGKTTLLHILALLLTPVAGTVQLYGSDAVREKDRRRLRRLVTLIHQQPVLFSTTVRGNLLYGLRAAGLSAREMKSRLDAALESFGIAGIARTNAREISGGEAQRVVLARGLILETPVLLLDEPTSFLDDAVRPLLLDRLRRAREERGATIIVATHDSNFVSSLANRILRLDQGRIVEEVRSSHRRNGSQTAAAVPHLRRSG